MKRNFLLSLSLCCLLPSLAYAEGDPDSNPTLNILGELGLNTVPSARMSPEGTMRFTVARMNPYTHAAMGLQISDKLYVALRQTSESDNVSSDSKKSLSWNGC